MPGMRDIKNKIKSLKGTKRITGAMKAVSAAKLRKAQADLYKIRPYADIMSDVMKNLCYRANPDEHPILAKRPVFRIELVLIGSDKGLCGAFNSNIIRAVNRFAKEKKREGVTLSLTTIGNKLSQFFSRHSKLKVRKEYRDIFRQIGIPLAEEIAEELFRGYVTEYCDEIYVVYNKFINPLVQEVVFEKLMPLEPEETSFKSDGEYYMEQEQTVIDEAVEAYLRAAIYRALKDSETSEHAARMTAMDNATKNTEDMIHKLTLSFNKARQAAITKELIEITTAIEAMKK